MKETTANAFLEVNCQCPECKAYLDIFDKAREVLGDDLRAESVDLEIRCTECLSLFIVTDINY